MHSSLLVLAALLLVARATADSQPQIEPASSGQSAAPVAPVVAASSPAIVSSNSNNNGIPNVEQPATIVHHTHQHEGHTHSYPGEHHTVEHGPHEHHVQEHPVYYAQPGLIQVVGGGVPVENGAQVLKPVVVHQAAPAASSEQYGQPESAGLPANYKPFGSWGLYIGGNPADGYYTNFYKALSNAVDQKQQVAGLEAPQAKPVSVSSAASQQPILRQAFVSPQAGSPVHASSYHDQIHPFDYYTPADLNSGSRLPLPESPLGPSSYAASAARFVSPVQAGAQVYGSPLTFGQPEPVPLTYADSYSTKRLGSSAAPVSQKPEQVPIKGQQQQQQQHYQYAAQVVPQQAAAQVVAYPVPVGSQIVGSQPGVESFFQPYGVHGFTRYAVKPTVVATSHSYYQQGVHSPSQFPVYKQQQSYAHHTVPVYQPLSFYGYPLSQLHYSKGAIVPAVSHQQAQPQQVAPVIGAAPAVQESPAAPAVQVEVPSPDKSESEPEKPQGASKQ